ncbi:MAG TPA: alkaline phosphatase family protein [Vicinamibacterales bacterium]|nr:alkaline phosphatase family protein [Vicinamibacterales bacterium]
MARNAIVAAVSAALLAAGIAVLWRTGEPHAPVTVRPANERPIPSSRDGRRVIFVGLDGADWSLLDRYAADGTMPALARLTREGASGTLSTIHPPLSPLIWTTMLTGVSPLEHRILDFLRVNPASGKREPITSDERHYPAIWNMASYAGKRVGALGFWATYPAEAVNGLMVSDRLFTFLYSESSPPPGVVNPTAREEWARGVLARVERDVGYQELEAILPWLSEREYGEAAKAVDPYSHPVSALRRILVETRVYDTLAREWFASEKPDLLLLYIQGTDSIGHVFAPYAPPRQDTITQPDYDRYHDVPKRYFAEIDRMLGDYATLAAANDSVLVLASDHGFKWSEGRPAALSSVANATAARWHTDDGIYLIWGKGVQPSQGHAGHGTVQQVCATLMALLGLAPGTGVGGPVLAGAPALAGDAVDYRARYTPAAVVNGPSAGAGAGADDETVAKLRALGYIGASSGGGRAIGTRTAGSFNNEALLLKQQGKTQPAMDALEQALVVDPSLASALWNLSDMLFAQRTSLDKSDGLLVRAFANGLPEGNRYLIGRAIGYQRSGQLDRAVKLLTDAAAAKPDEPEIWLFRGRYRMERQECAGALTDFQRATKLAPSNPAAFASQGVAQMCLNDTAGARASFQRSLELDPNQPDVRGYLRSTTTRGRS